jgi:hypothetical protein
MVAGAARALSTATWTQVVAAGHAGPMVDLIGEMAADALVQWLETAGVASQGMHVPEVASELVRLCKAWTPTHTPVPPTYASHSACVIASLDGSLPLHLPRLLR